MEWFANNWVWVVLPLTLIGLILLAWKMRGSILVSTALSAIKAVGRKIRRYWQERGGESSKTGTNKKEDKEKKTGRYRDPYHDRVVDRGRFRRLAFAVVFSAIVVFSPAAIIWWISPFEGLAWNIFYAAIGLGAGLFLLGKSLHLVTLSVPMMVGLVTQEMFSGERVVYGPGFHARYPWEEIHEDSNISLKTVTKVLDEKEFATKDDEVEVELSYQWAAWLEDLAIFISVDPSTIEEGFDSLFENLLAEMLADKHADEVIDDIDDYDKALQVLYEDETTEHCAHTEGRSAERHKKQKESLEEQYGIDLKMVRIERIQFSKEVREARAASAEASEFHRRIAKELGYKNEEELFTALRDGSLDHAKYKEARDTVLVTAEEITRDIREFVIPGLPELANALGTAAREFGQKKE